MTTSSASGRFLRVFLILAAACLFLFMCSSENAVAEGEVILIPVEETRFPALDPNFYLSETLYEDPSISVSIPHRMEDCPIPVDSLYRGTPVYFHR